MLDVVQGTPEWHALRLGKVTASRVADIIARVKGGYSTSRANYMAELICERLTGQPAERFQNDAMRWGTEVEPQARRAYSFMTDNEVTEVGFVVHPFLRMAGASPDGLIGEEGLVEIKAPNTATHIETLLSGKIADKYITQMTWQMACTGRQWCDFVSFDPRLSPELQLFIKRVEYDRILSGSLTDEVEKFLDELTDKVLALRAIGKRPAETNILAAG